MNTIAFQDRLESDRGCVVFYCYAVTPDNKKNLVKIFVSDELIQDQFRYDYKRLIDLTQDQLDAIKNVIQPYIEAVSLSTLPQNDYGTYEYSFVSKAD